jgi:hypothetical protein
LEEIAMRKLFLGRNRKPLISGIVTLSVVSLIIATTFMFTSMAFARDAPSFCNDPNSHIPRSVSKASCVNLVTNVIADPGQTKLIQDSTFVSALQTFLRNNAPSFTANSTSSSGSVGPTLHKNCNPNVDTLTGTNPMTFKVENVPYCDVVSWSFPNAANKACQFQADGAFSPNLKIDFYSNTSPNPNYLVTSAFVSKNRTFSAIGTNSVYAYLNEGTVKPNSTNKLGNIKYACQ